MRKQSLFAALIAAGMLSSLAAKAEATTIAYSSGHCVDTVAAAMGGVFLQAGNPECGFSSDNATLTSVISGGGFDALVIGESEFYEAAARTNIYNYTAAGGHTVVLGAHGSEAAFLNDVFGFSVTQHLGASSYDHAPISRVAGSGPESLVTLNGSWFIDNAPGTVLYTRDAGGTAAFVATVGTGTLSWLAWDFCECGELDSQQADWFSVLGSSAIQEGGGVPVPEPSMLSLFGAGISALAMRLRKRRKSSAPVAA